MSRTSRIALAILVILIAVVSVARLRYPGKAPVKLQAEVCDSNLWKHVYQNERLHVIEPCTAVQGVVSSLYRESDGDLHVSLNPDQKSVLNLFNLAHGHGKLVAEVICEHAPTDNSAAAACEGFRQQIAIPSVGQRVRITGAYVTDGEYGWTEVHPVTRIEVLR
jgi:hypothetical protein